MLYRSVSHCGKCRRVLSSTAPRCAARIPSRSRPCGSAVDLPGSRMVRKQSSVSAGPSRRCLNMAAPRQQIQPPTQAKMAFLMFTHTTGRHSRTPHWALWQCHSLEHELRTREREPHIHRLSSSSQQMWKQAWCSLISTMEKQMAEGSSAKSLRPT